MQTIDHETTEPVLSSAVVLRIERFFPLYSYLRLELRQAAQR